MSMQSVKLGRFLAFDTSTCMLAAALMERTQLMIEHCEQAERSHSVRIIPVIEQLLARTQTCRTHIAGIAVGVGPGSYTGIRVAVTAAKTLAWLWNIPLVGVSSLHAIGWGGFQTSTVDTKDVRVEWIIPLTDARRNRAYNALFVHNDSASFERLEKDNICNIYDMLYRLEARLLQTNVADRPLRISFVGQVAAYVQPLTVFGQQINIEVRSVPYELGGRFIGHIGAELLLQGRRDEPHALSPHYAQLAEAEANLLRR